MKKLLVINASARKQHSHSRTLTEVFISYWRELHKEALINFRDLGGVGVPHINEDWISASVKPLVARTQKDWDVLSTSDAYIDELRAADIIVLGTPMYNWSVPSTLKAYIDQIMRLNETFKFTSGDTKAPYIGLLTNKTLVLLVARGNHGYETGEPNEHLNFQTTYLKTIFNIVGIEDIHIVAVNGTSLDKNVLTLTIEHAHQRIRSLINKIQQ